MTIDVAARLQTNMLIESSEHISIYKDVPRTFMPVFWVEQKFTIDEQKSELLRYALNVPFYAKLCGVVLIFLGTAMTLFRHFKKRCCNIFVKEETKKEISDNVILGEVEKPFMLEETTEKYEK